MTQYSKMTFEEFVAYAKDYTIDGCHPQIVDEAIARLNSLYEDNKELKTENQILSQKRFNIFERIEYSDKLKIKAYKECIEKVYKFICDKENWGVLHREFLENGECYWLKQKLDNLLKEFMGNDK